RGDGSSRRSSGLAAAALVAGTLVALVPWSVVASTVADRFVLVTSGGGSNLFVGTYLPGDGSIFKMKRSLADEGKQRFPRYRETRDANVPGRIVLDAVALRRPTLTRDAALRGEGLANLRRYALGRPIAYAGMTGRKLGRLWLGVSVGTHHTVRAWVRPLHVGLVGLAAAGLLAGLILGPRRPALWLAAATLLYVTAINAVFVAEARHNLPVMPVLLAAGAAGGVLALRRLRTNVRFRRGRGVPTLSGSWTGSRPSSSGSRRG
nr:hypothetical protein [Solirubrobacterales bacterium]